MIRRLVPKFARRGWFGSMPVGDGDRDGKGVSIAVEWLGLTIEIVFAREDRA